MRRSVATVAVILSGCGGAGTEMVDSFLSSANAMASEADDHARQVDGAGTTGEVTTLIDAHAARMSGLGDRMGGMMGEMRGCGMHGSSSAALDDVATQMDRMDAEMGAYRTAHEGHGSIEECRQAAAEHARWVDERVVRMRGHRGHMMNGMSCGQMGMMNR